METAITNLNNVTDLREKMIDTILSSRTNHLSQKQIDAMEKRLRDQPFATLKKRYDKIIYQLTN